MLRLNSIRARLTLWYSAVLGALVVAFAVGSFLVIRDLLNRRANRFLRDAVATFRAEVVKETLPGLDPIVVVADELADYRFREIDFYVFDRTRLLGQTPTRPDATSSADVEVPLDLARLERELRTHRRERDFVLDDDEGGFHVASAVAAVRRDTLLIAAVQSWHGYSETMELIATGYAIIVPILLLLASLGGYWLAARGLAPVAAMSRKAASIGSANIGERLVSSNPHDELGQLADVFNAMLGRLDSAFSQQQRFMQDASHELRSPVAAIRMEAEVTLQNASRTEAEYRDALVTVRQSALRLSRIVDDLFFLARHDAEAEHGATELLDLGEVVHDAVRSLRPLAVARGMRLDLSDPPESPVLGRRTELERIVINVVGNAVKFAPDSSRIDVEIGTVDDSASEFVVRISDEGPGVDPAAHERMFDRFFRAAVASSASGQSDHHATSDGAGLGLPIARALAQSHGGTLTLESSTAAGTSFRWTIPRAPDA
jgi:signal transduction histidine kinase